MMLVQEPTPTRPQCNNDNTRRWPGARVTAAICGSMNRVCGDWQTVMASSASSLPAPGLAVYVRAYLIGQLYPPEPRQNTPTYRLWLATAGVVKRCLWAHVVATCTQYGSAASTSTPCVSWRFCHGSTTATWKSEASATVPVLRTANLTLVQLPEPPHWLMAMSQNHSPLGMVVVLHVEKNELATAGQPGVRSSSDVSEGLRL